MAKVIERIVTLIDDLDGGAAEETVHFSLDGTKYSLDLSKKNADYLRRMLAPYIKATGKRPTARQRANGKTTINSKAVRAWAAKKGLDVSPRGKVPDAVMEQYAKSH